jgi:predicted AAA+ superfamily ATPase
MILRIIEKQLKKHLFQGRAIILYGARRVGKTTLTQTILSQYPDKKPKYINCELVANKQALEIHDAAQLKSFLGDSELVALDEAQNIEGIGKTIKIIVDTYPHIQVIATGSSSFDLANKTVESMAGRLYSFMLYPFSVGEIEQGKGYGEIESRLENLLRFGSYPEIIDQTEDIARRRLDELVSTYLYKDVIAFGGMRNSKLIVDLLQLLALQVGSEVSYNELATKIGIDRLTVIKYINLLEQSFIIFTLRALSRNPRNEISKSVKIYFYDLGIRNSLVQAYNPLAIRTDVGALWENFCIVERWKLVKYLPLHRNVFFWRTYDQKEIDYIEEHDSIFEGFEFKWGLHDRPFKVPQKFAELYEHSTVKRIDRSNYWQFLLPNPA